MTVCSSTTPMVLWLQNYAHVHFWSRTSYCTKHIPSIMVTRSLTLKRGSATLRTFSTLFHRTCLQRNQSFSWICQGPHSRSMHLSLMKTWKVFLVASMHHHHHSSLPILSSQCRSPYFQVGLSQQFPRPSSLSVPPLLDGPSAGLMSPPPFGPMTPPSLMPMIPPCLMPTMPPPSPMPPMVMPPVELPHPSDDGQVQSTPSAASGSTFKPEPVEQVLLETQCFFTDKHIDRVAIAIAKCRFFGEAALAAATLYGKRGTKQKLTELRKALEPIPLFLTKTPSEKEQTWKQCLTAIANSCKEWRKKECKDNNWGRSSLIFVYFCYLLSIFPLPMCMNSRTDSFIELSFLLFNLFLSFGKLELWRAHSPHTRIAQLSPL